MVDGAEACQFVFVRRQMRTISSSGHGHGFARGSDPTQMGHLSHNFVQGVSAAGTRFRRRKERSAIQKSLESRASTKDTSFHRSKGDVANQRCLFIGKPASSDEENGLPLRLRQMRQRADHIGKLSGPILFVRRRWNTLQQLRDRHAFAKASWVRSSARSRLLRNIDREKARSNGMTVARLALNSASDSLWPRRRLLVGSLCCDSTVAGLIVTSTMFVLLSDDGQRGCRARPGNYSGYAPLAHCQKEGAGLIRAVPRFDRRERFVAMRASRFRERHHMQSPIERPYDARAAGRTGFVHRKTLVLRDRQGAYRVATRISPEGDSWSIATHLISPPNWPPRVW